MDKLTLIPTTNIADMPLLVNLLAIIIALRPKFRGNSFGAFLVTLATADALVLWTQVFILRIYYEVSTAYCMTRPFIMMFPEAVANCVIAGE